MKKLLVLALALILALGCVSALAEEELPESLDIRVLVWKYDDTYGSTVRAAMEKWAAYYSEEMGIDIQLTMYDAADDIGKQIEQAHMRNRQLIGRWACDLGAAGRVIEQVVEEEKTYFVVNDFDALRAIFGRMLREVQRIKSEGDFVAGRDLVERYGIRVDPALHAEVLERYARLGIRPYAGFVNPTYTPVTDASGAIVDIRCTTQAGYAEQMLAYSDRYSFLPTDNNR